MILIIEKYKWLLLIISLFFVLGILRLNDLSLYTDCTRYLIWGNSIAHGNGFVDDTQPEPEYYVVNAPLFSIILAPVLLIFPLSLIAAKIWTLLWGVLSIILFFHWIEHHLSRSYSYAATIFLAFNPLTIILSTEVLSETSFLCAIFGILILLDRLENNNKHIWETISIVFILSLITLIREVGTALVGSSIIFLLVKKKWRIAIIASLGAIILFALWSYRNLVLVGAPTTSQSPNLVFIFQHFVTPPNTTLLHEINQRILINFQSYVTGLSGMLLFYFPGNLIVEPTAFYLTISSALNVLKNFAFIGFIPLIIAGIYFDFTRSRTGLFRFLFLSIYIVIILIYPVQDARFLFPIIPFAIYYIAMAIRAAITFIRFKKFFTPIPGIAMFLILLFPNLICIYEIVCTNILYRRDPSNFSIKHSISLSRESYFSTPWAIIGEWIDKVVPANSIIGVPAKEIVPYAPRHKFLELNRAAPLPLFESLLRDKAAEYLLAPFVFDSIVDYQAMINESKRFRFEKLQSINRINIFRIYSRLENPEADLVKASIISDTSNSAELFRAGRFALKNGHYSDALSSFSILEKRYPKISDIKYQILLIHSFKLDSINAVQYLREIFTSPIATSYISPAQLHIRTMNLLLQSKLINDPLLRAENILNVSRMYWQLGYPKQAFRLAQQSINLDTSFFVGYLWAWHYGTQIGDTLNTKKYLSELEKIDRDNPIVRCYRKMTSYREQLKQTKDNQKQSNLHLAMSYEYEAIELTEEALDEVQKAIGLNSKNLEARHYLASLFQKRNNPLAAKRAVKKISEMGQDK